jgi:hypothetical protein
MNFNLSILGALVPIFIVIISGYSLRRYQFPGDAFWPYVERLTYFVLFPSLLLQKTATAPLDFHALAPMASALISAVLAMTALLFLIRPWWSAGAAAFASFFQGCLRLNTYVGLSAAFALLGDEGLALAAVAIAVLIPLVNILSVTVLVISSESERKDWQAVIKGVTHNPLILACLAGIFLNVSGIGLHSILSDILLIFGRASLPLGLLAVGAEMDITAIRNAGKVVLLSCVLKLLVMPALMWTASILLHVNPTATVIIVLFAALPVNATSYILARQLGGDSLLMANIVTVQVLFSMLTIPVMMKLLIG